MKFTSTRNANQSYTLSEAMLSGLAPDGGLFIPEIFPQFKVDDFFSDSCWESLPGSYEEAMPYPDLNIDAFPIPYPDLCYQVLKPFFQGDTLSDSLETICQTAFNMPAPLVQLEPGVFMLELFHGPTLSFKDFGARFLAACLSTLANKPIRVMVATSGDTGSAVAAAFHQKPNIDVIVLFPYQKISERQQQQITCWRDNIHAFAVNGTFDDCQRLVKSAFFDPHWKTHYTLCTANSINLGRLLPQVCYYAYSSLHIFKTTHKKANFIVPSGNLGNVTAAYWAKKMGFPIQKIHIATNKNRVISDYIETGNYTPRQSIHTLANAMDVGNPSNFERLIALFKDYNDFKKSVMAYSVSDEQIKDSIKDMFIKHGKIVCPHTATACWALTQMNLRSSGNICSATETDQEPWVIVATADPCKFETIVEPIIQQHVPIKPVLSKLLAKESQFTLIEPHLDLISH